MSRADYLSQTMRSAASRRHAARRFPKAAPTVAEEPLVIIGQGDSRREIRGEHLERQGTPWAVLCVLWLAFGVLAWLVSLPKH